MHSPALLPSIRVISNVLAELPNCILLRNVKDNKILLPSYSNFTNPMCSIELILESITKLINIVKLRQGSGKDRQGMALKAKGVKA